MISTKPFAYCPKESECEKASLAYLISVLSLIAGIPFPPVTLFASVGIFLGYRNYSNYVKWHCTQALLIQIFAFFLNSVAFVWTMLLFFTEIPITNYFIAYFLTSCIINVVLLFGTVYSASKSRKGIHTEWIFFGPITLAIYSPKTK